MELKLKGKRALITGASKGIGRACAEMLAAEGCALLLCARDKQALESAAAGLRTRHGAEVRWRAADLAQRGETDGLAGWAGELDILVNNAGAIPGGDLQKVDEHTWRRAWDLKVFGTINLTREVYARMKDRRQGVIINIIGGAGEKMDANYIAGSSANAGLMAFTRALGGASHADGIRVLGINPGLTATDRMVALLKQRAEAKFGDASRYQELYASLPFGRPAAPEEIAAAVAFLASERSAYTSGCIVTIDGGKAAT
jgi:NAD(P)-dependent dehydrogenase (short-subunit alcohol dehydrogenase family)